MSQSPPENQDFLSKTVENIKDMQTVPRFILVAFILIIFALLSNVVFPDNLLPLIYILLIGGLLGYLFWEFQQHKATQSERADQREQKKMNLLMIWTKTSCILNMKIRRMSEIISLR